MHGETPQFKRCCFCIPLRGGLLVWGYVKLVASILSLAYVITDFTMLASRTGNHFPAQVIAIIAFICAALITDVSLNIIFIVAGHQKSVKLLRVSYIYNVVWLGLVLLGNCFLLYLNLRFLYKMWGYMYFLHLVFEFLLESALAFSSIFVQVYLILLIRSEMIKLRHQALEMQFTNHLASGEPQCTLHNASTSETDQCTIETTDVQDYCTNEGIGQATVAPDEPQCTFHNASTSETDQCTIETTDVQDYCTNEGIGQATVAPDEPQCTLHNASTSETDQCTIETTDVQDYCTNEGIGQATVASGEPQCTLHNASMSETDQCTIETAEVKDCCTDEGIGNATVAGKILDN